MDLLEKVLAGLAAAWGVTALAAILFGRKARPGEVPSGALHEGRARR